MRYLLSTVLIAMSACRPAEPPSHVQVVQLWGSPYERGYQHGQQLSSKIRSFYTRMLTTSLMPDLNRERPTLDSVLFEYQRSIYDNGQFAQRLLQDNADRLAESIPQEYLDEMHGVADGAGLDFEKILILNTFVDSFLGIRAVQLFLNVHSGPQLTAVDILPGPSGVRLDSDGIDNDGDGDIDEAGEGTIAPYEPSPHALLTEVPLDSRLVLHLDDPDGVDPSSVRVHVGDRLFVAGDPALQSQTNGTSLEVTITPPGGLPAAAVVPVQVQAGDLAVVTDPPPAHEHFMRDAWFALGTKGIGSPPDALRNDGRRTDRMVAPSIAFAVRGSKTRDGSLLFAHHFALLDAGTAHEHTVLFVVHPDQGPGFVYLGWAGVIWGMSGMNADGLVYATDLSDSLDMPITDELRRHLVAAKLETHGLPVGLLGRELLSGAKTVADAQSLIDAAPMTAGWNFLVADRQNHMLAIERDANILGSADGGHYDYDSSAVDAAGAPVASTGPDDLRIASHFQENTDDIDISVLGIRVPPQRFWSSMYHRSVRAFDLLGDQIRAAGNLDANGVMAILRDPDLVDPRDSMNAAVYEPDTQQLHYAMGQVPATDGPFIPFDLGAALQESRP